MVSRYTYAVNPITQRESVTTAGLAFGGTQANWRWDYDALGQVVRADNTTTNASDRSYAYDNIGNRLTSGAGVSLASLSTYTPNALNQYTQITTTSQPTVNPSFDADGNMSAGPVPGSAGNDPGIQAPANATEMKWDAENRLVFMKVGTQPVYFDYDYLSRLIARGITMPIRRHYCYDGWNRISEYIAGTVFNTFTWGTDLSGSMQGAGGVGGLLAMRWVDSSGNADYFPTYDGNGNVSEYLRTTGGIAAHYEYDPFGRLTRLTGHTDTRFQYRFSTKPRDFDSGLYYYGYRWYDPLTGRWPSRDPIEESGGLNFYGFVGNDGVNSIDLFGLATWKWNEPIERPYDLDYDPAITRKKHLNPRRVQWWSERLLIEVRARWQDPLSWELVQHYFNGKGADFDVTGKKNIEDEVKKTLENHKKTSLEDIRKVVENTECPNMHSLNPTNYTIAFLGDKEYSSPERVDFTSSVFVIRKAEAIYSKKNRAILVCKCNPKSSKMEPWVAYTNTDFRMYFYDQFADAADFDHTNKWNDEFEQGKEFNVIGAWGLRIYQKGLFE